MTSAHRFRSLSLFLFGLLCLSFAVSAEPTDELRFNGQSAFQFLYKQVQMGTREPGSAGHKKAIDAYVEWFEECGGEVELQYFKANIHTKPEADSELREVQGINVIARFGPGRLTDYLLCAHYDTRPWADHDPDESRRLEPIPGANDGASGVAVLLEMARLFAIQPPESRIEIVLFDVEDAGVPGINESYCHGSAYYAQSHAGSAPIGAILLDMIGDSDLMINKEAFSYTYAREWTDHIFQLAEEVGATAFYNEEGMPVYDDHVNLLRAGIPACDLIDFDYPPWHTHQDVPAACAPESLEQVGRVLVRLIYGK